MAKYPKTHDADSYAHQLVDGEASNRARDNARFGLERQTLEHDIIQHAAAAGSPKAVPGPGMAGGRIKQEVDHVGDKAVGHSPSSAPDDTRESSQTGRYHSHKS